MLIDIFQAQTEKRLWANLGTASELLAARVLGHSFSPLRDGVLGEFPGQEQPDGGLNLAGGDGGPLVVIGQSARFGSNPLEQIVHEGVHDAHGLGRDASIRVNLLQHLSNKGNQTR